MKLTSEMNADMIGTKLKQPLTAFQGKLLNLYRLHFSIVSMSKNKTVKGRSMKFLNTIIELLGNKNATIEALPELDGLIEKASDSLMETYFEL
jgi:hypothetical protein